MQALSDYLEQDFDGVTLNQTQDDPFQADLQYHGFIASPLLGAPEGLSVYVDGVRVNEAFGNTVNWDLIPDSAIHRVTLLSGSNPVFGLNTLGGALAIATRNGSDSPGYEAEGSLGSYGGRDAEASAGGASGNVDGFLTARYFQESGWRDHSPSRLSQVFGKLGWHDQRGRVDLSYTGADTRLTGEGSTPDSLLARDYAAIYTAPDITRNHLDFFNLTALRFVDGAMYLSGNAYYRRLVTGSENGDVNNGNYLNDAAGSVADCGTSEPVSLAFCSIGVDRRSALTQRSYGLGTQASRAMGPGRNDQLTVGFSWDGSHDWYAQTLQYGGLTPERLFVPDRVAAQAISGIAGTTATLGVYVMDNYSPVSWLQLTGSLRWNHEHLRLDGNSNDTNLDDLGSGFGTVRPVTGDEYFSRFDPALGFTTVPASGLSFYGEYDEGMRAPSVVELGCADPKAPCGLPDEFAGDPPLKPVVAHTFELGVRSDGDRAFAWGVDLFHTRSSDDIQFISSPGNPDAGYFANVGDTLRQGLDAHVQGVDGAFSWRLSASLLRASFESSFLEGNTDSNSSANRKGQVTVHPGDALPLTPEHSGRASLAYKIDERWSIGGDAAYSSGSNLRGNENGSNQAGVISAGGEFIAGSGRIGGFTVFGVRSDFQVSKALSLFVRVDNLLDKRYATAGFLGDDSLRPDGSFRSNGLVTHEDEVSPGAPRSFWLGAEFHW